MIEVIDIHPPYRWVAAFIEGGQVAAVIPMDANDLLAVSPKLLAQAILHRRERLSEIIPDGWKRGRKSCKPLNQRPKQQEKRGIK